MENETQEKDQNSVEIKINASGKFSGGLKVYAKTIGTALELSKKKSEELENYLKEKNDTNKRV